MPKQNGTGPDGKGTRSGRGLGRCGQKTEGPDAQGYGRGRGCGMGRRAGRGSEGPPTSFEKTTLEENVRYLEEELTNMKQALINLQEERKD